MRKRTAEATVAAASFIPLPTRVTLLILLPGRDSFEPIDVEGPLVGHVKATVISNFKNRYSGVDTDQLLLLKQNDDGSLVPLISTQTLHEAGLVANTKLVVKTIAAGASSEVCAYCVSNDIVPALSLLRSHLPVSIH